MANLVTLKITAPKIVADSSTILDYATVIVHNGAVEELGPAESLQSVNADKSIKLRGVLHPGFINAHCHLDLSFMRGRLKPSKDFTQWIRALVTLRKETNERSVIAGIRKGVRRLFETGTTCVGDISTFGQSTLLLHNAGMRAVIFHELLGYDPSDVKDRMADFKRRIGSAPASPLLAHGLSPHAVYSVSQKLMSEAARYAKRQKAPMAIHLCETPDETEFCKKGTGPFKEFLESFKLLDAGGFPKTSPVKAAAKSGALNGALAIHMNHPSRGDLAELEQRSARVAYCPNSNKWFKRKIDHPLMKLLRRKIPVGLGTDSLASNNDLNIRAEAGTVLKNFRDLTPADVFELMTTGGAKALGLPNGIGTLRPGAPFDAVSANLEISRRADPLLAIIKSDASVARVWVSGAERFRSRR